MVLNSQIALMMLRHTRPAWWPDDAVIARQRYDAAVSRLAHADALWERALDRKHGDLEGAKAEHQAAMHDLYVAGLATRRGPLRETRKQPYSKPTATVLCGSVTPG